MEKKKERHPLAETIRGAGHPAFRPRKRPAMAETIRGEGQPSFTARLIGVEVESRCSALVDGGRCAGLAGHDGEHYANARERSVR